MASARGPAADEGAALRALAAVVGALTTLAMALAAAALLVSLALIGWAVVMRYFFAAAPIWSSRNRQCAACSGKTPT